MAVRDFMSTDLVTVAPTTPIFDAIDLMKENDIHRLPVLADDKLVGLITQGVIQEAMPSQATSLSVHEVNYLLNKTTVADVMIKKVETIEPDAILEKAIFIMRKNNIGVLPVLERNHLLGVITNNDIFDAFLKITDYKTGGTRVVIEITEDHPGILANVTQVLAQAKLSISTIVVDHRSDKTMIEIQIVSKEVEKISSVLKEAGYHVSSCVAN
ncbi:MAG TPA: CBS domain-containing protein [Tetragenococcus sp.]|nr:CBS domain-containing protein [Tetragenococcus sp.]